MYLNWIRAIEAAVGLVGQESTQPKVQVVHGTFCDYRVHMLHRPGFIWALDFGGYGFFF